MTEFCNPRGFIIIYSTSHTKIWHHTAPQVNAEPNPRFYHSPASTGLREHITTRTVECWKFLFKMEYI